MPVGFLPNERRESYGRYGVAISSDDADHALIAKKRGDYNRFGFAVQLCTVRYLGTFLDDPLEVPVPVMHTLAKQLGIEVEERLRAYSIGEQRWQHAAEIRSRYGYVDFLKWAALPPKPSEAQVQGWFLLLTEQPIFQVFHKLTRFFFLFFLVYSLVYKSWRPCQTWL